MTGALMTAAGFPMKIFISYSHVDDELFKALELRLRSIDDIFPDIDAWSDQRIPAGGDWHGEIQAALNAAQVVLLLVSPEFKASRYIRDHELEPALAREARGECVVVPVIVRDTPLWEESAFARLQVLPTGGKPVKAWRSRDKAWKDVVENLVKTAEDKGLLRAATPDRLPPPRAKNAVFHVPFARNPYFAGRAAELEWLHGALNNPDKRPAALLAGIGGVGKTATAAQYALLHRKDYGVVWWVEAETAEGRDLSFAGLAAKLRLPGYQSPKLEEVRAEVRQWLSDHDDWLLIFDNADAPADLRGWLPTHLAGHALITSRNPAWGVHAQRWAVTVWDVPTAAGFLLKRSGCKDEAAARELAEKLGGLPLACEQAGAYIEANGVTLRTYIKLFGESLADMLEEGADPDIHPSLTATVRLGLQSLAAENPLALQILRTLACFAPDDIPRFLPDKWQGAEAKEVREAVGLLLRRALLRGAEDNLSIHRLVQALIRAADPDQTATQATAVVLLKDSIDGSNPQTDAHLWPTYAALFPHAAALFAVLPDPPPEPAAAGYVCNEFGTFLLIARGDYRLAKDWLARALRIAETHLPADDPELAGYINNLGAVLDELGDPGGAAACYRRALKIFEKHLGADHPNVGVLVNNLGAVLKLQGDLDGAKAQFERALKIDEAHAGPDHPDVAVGVNNLGAVLGDQGDLAGARAQYQRALKIDEGHYGPDHPEVAADLNNLGVLSYGEGDYKEAVAFARRALAIREKHLPPEHPDVQMSRRHLAEAEAALAAPPAPPAPRL
jgi:tetratricopeptide (TPR) repeat protein